MTPDLLSNPLFKDYFNNNHGYDELLGEDGRLRPHWETFFQSYNQLGNEEISSRNEDMMRLLKLRH